MDYKKYLALVGECVNTKTKEDFLAEYGYPEDCEWSPEVLIKAMQIIFAVSRNDFFTLTKDLNISAFCRVYNIPLRSAQNWVSGERKPPEYLLQLIGYALLSELPKEEK